MKAVDQKKSGKLVEDLGNQFALGNDQFPTTVVRATEAVVAYQNRINANNNNSGNNNRNRNNNNAAQHQNNNGNQSNPNQNVSFNQQQTQYITNQNRNGRDYSKVCVCVFGLQ